jgi:hypothetical protein
MAMFTRNTNFVSSDRKFVLRVNTPLGHPDLPLLSITHKNGKKHRQETVFGIYRLE